MAPENRPPEKEIPVGTHHFRGKLLVSGRVNPSFTWDFQVPGSCKNQLAVEPSYLAALLVWGKYSQRQKSSESCSFGTFVLPCVFLLHDKQTTAWQLGRDLQD